MPVRFVCLPMHAHHRRVDALLGEEGNGEDVVGGVEAQQRNGLAVVVGRPPPIGGGLVIVGRDRKRWAETEEDPDVGRAGEESAIPDPGQREVENRNHVVIELVESE